MSFPCAGGRKDERSFSHKGEAKRVAVPGRGFGGGFSKIQRNNPRKQGIFGGLLKIKTSCNIFVT
jgi:hypothetical protein